VRCTHCQNRLALLPSSGRCDLRFCCDRAIRRGFAIRYRAAGTRDWHAAPFTAIPDKERQERSSVFKVQRISEPGITAYEVEERK
jgi:hypothetical protein